MGTELEIVPAPRTRPAAALIQRIEHETLGDSAYGVDELLAVLERPEHVTYLARLGAEAVGFCSCFATPADVGWRLEIDMLGVLAAHRRRGVASALLRAAAQAACQAGASSLRGVVATNNLASQGAFRRAGLEPQPAPCDMLVYEISGAVPRDYLPAGWRAERVEQGPVAPPGAEAAPWSAEGSGRHIERLRDAWGLVAALAQVQQVYTLAYRGLWLERLWGATPSAAALAARAAVEYAKAHDLDEVGYLLSQTADLIPIRTALLREGFQLAGSYYVYTGSACVRSALSD